MPDVAQKPETIRDPAQPDRNEPRGDDQQRDRRDVDAKQVDLKERQAGSPASKYARCWTRASRTRSTIARVRSARKACGPDSARAARRRSRPANRTRWRRRYILAPRPRAPRRAPGSSRVEVQSAAD